MGGHTDRNSGEGNHRINQLNRSTWCMWLWWYCV